MAVVAQDLIQSALEKLGAYGVGQTVNTQDLDRSLEVMNAMLDSWSAESLSVFAWETITFPLVANQGAYTIGTSGSPNISHTRPMDLRTGPGAAYLQDTNLNNYPVDVVPQDYWQMIGNRSVNSQIPDTVFYDPQFPNGIINVFPLPSIAYNMIVNAVLQLTQYATLQTTVTLPPGYKYAIENNLAVELKPYFPAGKLADSVIVAAMNGKGVIKRRNIREIVAVYDQEIVSRGAPTYNIYRDSNN